MAAAGLALGACGDDGGKEVSTATLERSIRADYEEQLRDELSGASAGTVQVAGVECVKKSDREAKCFATVEGALSGRTGIDVTIGEDGEFIWDAEAAEANLTPKAEAPLDESAEEEEARLAGSLSLTPVEDLEGDNEAQGLAAVAERGGERQLIVQAQLPRNARNEAYQIWLYNSDEDAVSLGAQVADDQGNFQGAGPLPDDFEDYEFIDVSREPIRGPDAHSGNSVLRGTLADL